MTVHIFIDGPWQNDTASSGHKMSLMLYMAYILQWSSKQKGKGWGEFVEDPEISSCKFYQILSSYLMVLQFCFLQQYNEGVGKSILKERLGCYGEHDLRH